MQTERRWLKAAILAASGPVPALPWERMAKANPAPVQPSASMAAR